MVIALSVQASTQLRTLSPSAAVAANPAVPPQHPQPPHTRATQPFEARGHESDVL
jgi:hypothetical protein